MSPNQKVNQQQENSQRMTGLGIPREQQLQIKTFCPSGEKVLINFSITGYEGIRFQNIIDFLIEE